MDKIRIYALAHDLRCSSRDVIKLLEELGQKNITAASTIDISLAKEVENQVRKRAKKCQPNNSIRQQLLQERRDTKAHTLKQSSKPISDQSNIPSGALKNDSATIEPSSITVKKGDTGWSYKRIFGEYLRGASKIQIIDPYINTNSQLRNLLDFLVMLYYLEDIDRQVSVNLITKEFLPESPQDNKKTQENLLKEIKHGIADTHIEFTWEIDNTIHARSVTADTGWEIQIDRGLDIFQPFRGGLLSVKSAIQEIRSLRGMTITYVKIRT